MRRERSAYDAPELPDSPSTPAADVWSLGVTLVEAFTQQPAVLPFNEQSDPIIPPIIREPFLEITRNTLRRRPRLRWSSADIAEKLNPTAATAKAAAVGVGATSAGGALASASASAMAISASPVAAPVVAAVDVPLSQEPAVPLAELRPPEPAMRPAMPRPPMREEGVERRETVVLPNYVIPVFTGALVLIALILLPFALRHRASPQASSVVPSGTANVMQAPASATNSSAANVPSAANLPPVKSVPPPSAATAARPQPAAPNPTASPLANSKSSAVVRPTDASATVGKGEVLDQVAPAASPKALATISGTVRVGVKVHVDAAGNVSDAALQNSGPSRYFSGLSLKAAQQWVFTPPEVNGRSVPSDWVIQFHFTKAGPQMSSQQVAP